LPVRSDYPTRRYYLIGVRMRDIDERMERLAGVAQNAAIIGHVRVFPLQYAFRAGR
jgi:hypothetical protein